MWDEETIERMRVMVDNGLSSGRIAKVLGITRNAVIGKVIRMGFRLKGAATDESKSYSSKVGVLNAKVKKQATPRAIRKSKVAYGRAEFQAGPSDLAEIAARMRDDTAPADIGIGRKSLIELDRNECKYGIGDVGQPGFHFCARPTDDGMSWCDYHYGRVFQARPVRNKVRVAA